MAAVFQLDVLAASTPYSPSVTGMTADTPLP